MNIPKKINHLSIAFDVSTSNTGYAILADDKPLLNEKNQVSIGAIKMVESNGKKDKQYDNYGNRMFHGSANAFIQISNMLYTFLKPMTDVYYKSKKEPAPKTSFDIDKITLVFEISDIPNWGRNGQTITTTRKLALYTGAVVSIVRNIIGLVFEPWKDKINCKFINPTEWQNKFWTTQEIKEAETKELRGTKVLSLKLANNFLKEFDLSLTSDDAADALLIATISTIVNDNLFVSRAKVQKAKNKNKLLKQRLEIQNKIAKINAIANERYTKFINDINWMKSNNYNQLSTTDKNKYSKIKNKYENNHNFLPIQLIDNKLRNKLLYLEKKLKENNETNN